MTTICDGKATALVDRLFLDTLSRRGWRKLRAHLGGCESCRAYYDRVVLLQRAMSPNHDLIGGVRLQRMADDLDELIGVTPAPRRWWAWATGAAAAAAMLFFVGATRGSNGTFVARGGGAPVRAEGLRAFCLDITARAPRVTASVAAQPAGGARLDCPTGGALQFAYTLGDGRPRYLSIVGVDGAGKITNYVPLEPGSPSLVVAAGAVDQPLAQSLRLQSLHRPGSVRVRAFFSDAPLTSPAEGPGIDVQELQLEVTP
jgi:hypothetical protein